MQVSVRTIREVVPQAGVDPTQVLDTDEDGPPVYLNVVRSPVRFYTVAPADSGLLVDIPACCQVLLWSDAPIILRLAAGETAMRVRRFEVGAEDETAAGVPAATWQIDGNTETTANVQIFLTEQVT